jgi:hypothetical protein
MSSAKRRLAVGGAALVVLAGSGGAYAATQSGSTATQRPDPAAQQKAYLDDVAKRLNVTRDQLDSALKGAAEDQVDAAVAAGKLTKDQGDAAKKRIESAGGVPLGGGFGFGGRGPGGPGGGGPGGPGGPLGFGFGSGKSLTVAATYLGVSDDALRKDLENGQSLADVAKAQSKDTAGLKAAMNTAITTELDQQVKDNKLTADQEKQFESNLDQRLDDLISNTRPKGGPQGFSFGRRHP